MERLKRAADVCGGNLKRLQEQKRSVDTRRAAHIRELALAFGRELPEDEDRAEEYRRLYLSLTGELGLAPKDKAVFCRYITEGQRYSATRVLLSTAQQKRSCSISYVRNPLSDLAYEAFATRFDRARISYAPDFVSALEDVYHSVSDYAILPFSNDKAGRLKSFFDLTQKYEMKTVLSTIVYSTTDDSETVFILVSKNCEILFGQRDREIKLDLTLPSGDLSSLLTVCEAFGNTLSGIDTDGDRCSVSLDITEGNADALCLYLLLESPGCDISGIYKLV